MFPCSQKEIGFYLKEKKMKVCIFFPIYRDVKKSGNSGNKSTKALFYKGLRVPKTSKKVGTEWEQWEQIGVKMDKSNEIYKILGAAWLLIKPYVDGIKGTEDEMQSFLIKQNDLVESFRGAGSAEHKFARDIVLACNNYYQFKYMEKKNGK